MDGVSLLILMLISWVRAEMVIVVYKMNRYLPFNLPFNE